MVTCAAILASFCVPLVLSTRPAAAAPTKLTVATGSITCRKLTGTITFTPPMHSGVNAMETRAISLQVSACTTKNSNVAHVSGGNLTVTARSAVEGCSAEETEVLTGVERWQPSSIAPSTVTVEGFARRANAGAKGLVYSNTPGLQQLIVVPAAGKSVSVRGSFAGKTSYISQENLRGSILAYTDRITGQLHAECKALAGLSLLSFVSGVETLP